MAQRIYLGPISFCFGWFI